MFGGRLSVGRDGTMLMYTTIVGKFHSFGKSGSTHFHSYCLDPYAVLLLSTEILDSS